MGENAVKSHAEGKKYASSVKVSQGTESVSDLFKKKEVSAEKCSSQKVRKHQLDLNHGCFSFCFTCIYI